jgi:hypothetical protein
MKDVGAGIKRIKSKVSPFRGRFRGGLILSLLFFGSCAESFKQIAPDKFNDTIAKRSDIKTSDDLIKAYYQYRSFYSEHAASPRLSITSRKLDSADYEITAIDTILDDDALSAEKIIMIATQHAQTWKALDIKYNWKSRSGYGSTEWGTGN